MEHEQSVNDYRWLWTVRPRRLGIGDLMFAVALAALACFATVLVLRSEAADGQRAAFGLLTLLLFAMQAAQWRLGGLPARNDPRSRRELVLGIASYLLAMVMFVLLLALAALFPDGAAIVVLALVVVALYFSTWE